MSVFSTLLCNTSRATVEGVHQHVVGGQRAHEDTLACTLVPLAVSLLYSNGIDVKYFLLDVQFDEES